jgi:hypothetical protein
MMTPAWAIWGFSSLALTLLAPSAALAGDRTAVQPVPCEPGPARLLARDDTVSACRLAVDVELLVGPAAGNGKVACSAGSRVEFHRTGFLSFCDSAAGAAAYLGRGGRRTQCRTHGRLAFDESGYLEYCS